MLSPELALHLGEHAFWVDLTFEPGQETLAAGLGASGAVDRTCPRSVSADPATLGRRTHENHSRCAVVRDTPLRPRVLRLLASSRHCRGSPEPSPSMLHSRLTDLHSPRSGSRPSAW